MRSPNSPEIRKWRVVDQIIPFSSTIEDVSLLPDNWLPIDSLGEDYGKMRRYSEFEAYHSEDNKDNLTNSNRLVGRSVWNTNWLLIIPGISLHENAKEGINRLLYGPIKDGSENEERTGDGIRDIKISFLTYSYTGS